MLLGRRSCSLGQVLELRVGVLGIVGRICIGWVGVSHSMDGFGLKMYFE